MSCSVSFVIPVFNLDGQHHRVRNLLFTIESALRSGAREVIVAEQVVGGRRTVPDLDEARYLPVESQTTDFEKAKVVNAAVAAASGDFVWVNDADYHMDFAEGISQIRPSDIALRPFVKVADLDPDATGEYIVTGKSSADLKRIKVLGPGSFIMRRKEYVRSRGMDERYKGWGFEDIEFGKRVEKLFPIRCMNLSAKHLYHPPSEKNQEPTKRNTELYQRSIEIISDDAAEQVARIRSRFAHTPWSRGRKGVVHVMPVVIQSEREDMLKRELISMMSILDSNRSNVILLAAMSREEAMQTDGIGALRSWRICPMNRDARDVAGDISYLFIKDMLDLGRAYCDKDDYILISNADCGVTKDLYRNLRSSDLDVVEYFRTNVAMASSVETLRTSEPSLRRLETTGIDAIAIKASTYDDTKDDLPDVLIGEPYWDAVLSGFYHSRADVGQNTDDLLHIAHERRWSLKDLTPAGRYNQQLWQQALDNNLLRQPRCEILEKQCEQPS